MKRSGSILPFHIAEKVMAADRYIGHNIDQTIEFYQQNHDFKN